MATFVRLRSLAINIDNITKINIEKDYMTVEFIGGKDLKLQQPDQVKRVTEAIDKLTGITDSPPGA